MKLFDVRRGFTLLEVCTAGAMLAVALSLTVSMTGAMVRQRRAAELRLRAIEIAENVLERTAGEPWAKVNAERLAELQADARADELLPEGELQLDVTVQPGAPPGKRVDLRLAWRPLTAKDRRQLRLTTWLYPAGGQDE